MRFDRMSKLELRRYIDGCHEARSFDAWFVAACRVWNSKYRCWNEVSPTAVDADLDRDLHDTKEAP